MTTLVDWIQKVRQSLDLATYYDLLRVPADATEAMIRSAYYHLVTQLHPDRHGDSLDADIRADLVSIYSRVVEAYRVLSAGTRRAQYDQLLAAGKRRWTNEEERAPLRRDTVELERLPASAQRFVKLGRQGLEGNDPRSAAMNLKLALSMAPDSELIKALLARAEAAIKAT